MEEQVEYPIIRVEGDTLTISITKEALIKVIEGRTDEVYEVVDKDRLLERFAFHLANYAESNATELGLSELQYLFDRVIDHLYESAEDVIDDGETYDYE